MTDYLQHIASEGDRWDSLAYQYYGNALIYGQIITANRHLPINATLKAGQIIFIPIIDPPQQPQDLPIWLQDDDDDIYEQEEA